jgi:Fe-S-cluster-containing hydrogenase component 2
MIREDGMSKKEEEEHQGHQGLSRRHFLRNSALAAAGFPLASLVIASRTQAAQAVPPGKAAEAAPKTVNAAKSLMIERKKCTGCNSCVFACSLYHDNEVRPATARIYVRRYYGLVDVPILCWHCPDAPCVEACPVTPVKAITTDKDSNVVKFTDESRCLGVEKCGKCVEVCPPRYLRAHPETNHPLFCDLCGGDPRCVQACNRQAKETGETLRCDTQVAGLHWSYREVTPEEAADGLMLSLFYPNQKGERR